MRGVPKRGRPPKPKPPHVLDLLPPGFEPRRPTAARPGTAAKMAVLRARVAAGIETDVTGDAAGDDELPKLLTSRSRGGFSRLACEQQPPPAGE